MGVDTGFRGSHRDAAMPPPSADHACMEDRDPHPCPEDEEFFECWPDAADMDMPLCSSCSQRARQSAPDSLVSGW